MTSSSLLEEMYTPSKTSRPKPSRTFQPGILTTHSNLLLLSTRTWSSIPLLLAMKMKKSSHPWMMILCQQMKMKDSSNPRWKTTTLEAPNPKNLQKGALTGPRPMLESPSFPSQTSTIGSMRSMLRSPFTALSIKY